MSRAITILQKTQCTSIIIPIKSDVSDNGVYRPIRDVVLTHGAAMDNLCLCWYCIIIPSHAWHKYQVYGIFTL